VKSMSRQKPLGTFLFFLSFFVPMVIVGTSSAETPNNDVQAAFVKAAFSGNLEEVERLLDNGANINEKREDGITALMGAAFEGHQDVVSFLLAKGADVHVRDDNVYGRSGGATACDLAAQKGHKDIVRLLVRAGAFYEEKAPSYQRAPAPESNHPTMRKRN
jgi:ankyrin repeat protein